MFECVCALSPFAAGRPARWPCRAPAAAEDVWALLKKPGHIVLLRHSNAPGSVPESNDMDFKNCSIQRNLDADGRAQAGRIGNEFRKHRIASRCG